MDISVVIPSYNRYKLLKRALTSVFLQTYLPKEVIVVDDGSDDATPQIQKDFPSIKYIYQKNQGVSAARNRGVKHAEHYWIAFLDSDDVWEKEKLQEQVNFHNKYPNILISYTDELWIRDGQCVRVPKKFQKIGKNAFLENLEYCNIAPSSVFMAKKLFDRFGYFDEAMEVCEDYDLWLRIAAYEDFGYINKKLIQKHAGQWEQLGFLHWGMDRWRVKSLHKVFNTSYSDAVLETLIKKYQLLRKGAMKYDKIASLNLYEKQLKELQKVKFERNNTRK